MNPWIQNVARSDIIRGLHMEPGFNSMLIQISDPPGDHPTPLYKFREVHQFDFLDIEADDFSMEEEWRCSQTQADKLVELLQHAMEEKMNVIVHCQAGVCRSGAVCEVGVMMGFRDTEVFRSPNLLVKHLMLKKLGLPFDKDEPHTTNGIPLPEDWANDNEKVFMLAEARREFRERN